MTGVFLALLWVVMALITATVLYILEANTNNGKRFGGYDWADEFICFHIAAGLFWPISLPIVFFMAALKFIGRTLRKRSVQ